MGCNRTIRQPGFGSQRSGDPPQAEGRRQQGCTRAGIVSQRSGWGRIVQLRKGCQGAVTRHVLVAILKKRLNVDHGLQTILEILSVALSGKSPERVDIRGYNFPVRFYQLTEAGNYVNQDFNTRIINAAPLKHRVGN